MLEARGSSAPQTNAIMGMSIAGSIDNLSRSLHRLDDLLRGVVKVVSRCYVEIRLGDNVLPKLHIGAFEPHHERHAQANLLHGVDNTGGDDVALHDAAEDVDQDAFHLRVGRDDLESGRYLVLGGTAANIEEV